MIRNVGNAWIERGELKTLKAGKFQSEMGRKGIHRGDFKVVCVGL